LGVFIALLFEDDLAVSLYGVRGLVGVGLRKPDFVGSYESLFCAEFAMKLFEGVKVGVSFGTARAIVSCGLFLAGFMATLFLRPDRAAFAGFSGVGGLAIADFRAQSFDAAVLYFSIPFAKKPRGFLLP